MNIQSVRDLIKNETNWKFWNSLTVKEDSGVRKENQEARYLSQYGLEDLIY